MRALAVLVIRLRLRHYVYFGEMLVLDVMEVAVLLWFVFCAGIQDIPKLVDLEGIGIA